MAAKRGRKPKHHVASTGDVIEGLTRRSNGNWTCTFDKNAHFGTVNTPEWEAIRRYRTWRARGKRIKFKDKGPPSKPVQRSWEHWAEKHPDPGARRHYQEALASNETVKQVDLDESVFWLKVQESLSTDQGRRGAAQRTGIKELAWLDEVKQPAKPLPLQAIGELYFGKVIKESKRAGEPTVFDTTNAKNIGHNQRTRTLRAWKEFCKSVGPAKSIEEVDESGIERWGRFLQANIKGAKTFRERISNVQTVLKYARPRHKQHIAHIDRVKLDISFLIQKPDEPEADPKPIKPKHFRAALDAASTKWKAALLCALNLALHPKEVADLRKDEIDLEDKTFVSNRTKRGRVRRCARLWDRTAEAILAYQRQEGNETDFMFVNKVGKPLNSHAVIDNWKRIRKAAGIPATVQFDSLRDGARTHMSGEGAAMVMGHSLGTADKYKLRMPNDPRVVEAVGDVERAYFGAE